MGDRGRVPDQLGIPSSGKDPPAEGKAIPTSGEAALADFLHPEVPGWGCFLRAGLQREWDPWDEGGASQGFRCSLAGRFLWKKIRVSSAADTDLFTHIYSPHTTTKIRCLLPNPHSPGRAARASPGRKSLSTCLMK